MATIHMSEADAARDFAGLIARVRAGVEVVIDDASPAVGVHRARRGHAKELGHEAVMNAEFAADMEKIVRNRKPRDTSAWDLSSTPAS